jgi:hypothetical protein
LGLEVLIIADIVLTITVDRTFDSALTLGLIVLVRTFLSFSLEIELEGAPALASRHHGEEAGRTSQRRRRIRMSDACESSLAGEDRLPGRRHDRSERHPARPGPSPARRAGRSERTMPMQQRRRESATRHRVVAHP